MAPPAVPSVVPVMEILPPPPVPVLSTTLAASATCTLSLIVMSVSAVVMLALSTVVAPAPSRVTDALPVPVIRPLTASVPPFGDWKVTGSLNVTALMVMPPVPLIRPIRIELKPS